MHTYARPDEPGESLHGTLVPIQQHGSSTPIYLVHEIRGGIACYSALADAMGTEQPVYAFRPPSPKHGVSIPEMAAHYLRDLLRFQPAGPYILGGYSFGGLVAFEMAQQLRERGEEADLVVMFDTWVPGFYSRLKLRERVAVTLGNAQEFGANYLVRKIHDKWKYWKRLATRNTLIFAGSLCERFGVSSAQNIYAAQAEVSNTSAVARYEPTPYHGKVLLIMSSDRARLLRRRGDPTLGWANFAGPCLEICTVGNDHTGFLMAPGVHEISRLLEGRLATLNGPGALVSCSDGR